MTSKLFSSLVLAVVKSLFTSVWTNITLAKYNVDSGTARKCLELLNDIQHIFAYCVFGPAKAQRLYIFVVEVDHSSFWFAEMWLLFHSFTHSALHDAHEFVYVQYIERAPSGDKVDRLFNCICIGWATDDEVDPIVDFNVWLSYTIEAVGWYGLVTFLYIILAHHNPR